MSLLPDLPQTAVDNENITGNLSSLTRRSFVGQLAEKRELVVITLTAVLICVAFVLYVGQDGNWDQQNYHFYAVYALLHGRVGHDIAPAELQTWFNPISYIPAYLLINHTTPIIASVILGVVPALTAPLVYILASMVFAPMRRSNHGTATLLCGASTFGAIAAPMFLMELGTTFNDNLIWLLVLAAIVVFLKQRDGLNSLVLTGVLLGAATGLKLTAVVYLCGFGAALLLDDFRRSPRRVVPLAIGFLAAFAIFGGIWAAYIYKLYANPVFPTYNNIFKSPEFAPTDLRDAHYVANSLLDIGQRILGIARGDHPTAELHFRDLRYLACTVILGAVLLKHAFSAVGACLNGGGHATGKQILNYANARFVVSFAIVAFFYWMFSFGIERYVIGLEQLGVLCALIGLAFLVGNERWMEPIGLVVACALIVTSEPANYGRIPFGTSWFDMTIPPELSQPNTLYVIIGVRGPVGYVVPFLPRSDKFIRLEGNMIIRPEHGLGAKITDMIRESRW